MNFIYSIIKFSTLKHPHLYLFAPVEISYQFQQMMQ